MSYGRLDIRIARSSDEFYFLEEGKTFSFRERNGVKTNSYLDMTAWDSNPYKQGNMRLSKMGASAYVMNYRILEPKNYNEHHAAGYPLVLVLHGLQERGNCAATSCYHGTVNYSPVDNNPAAPTTPSSQLLNNDYNLVHGGSNYLEAHSLNGTSLPDDPSLPARAFPGFVVFPQNLNGWDELAAEDAIRLVRLLIKKYNIDINRVYINGVSNGGHGAYEVIKRAPWLFAAGVLFSAADDASIIDQNMESAISSIPLWIFQGGADKNPSPKKTEGYIKLLRNAGADIRYTLYPQLGHGTWNKAFSEPDFFSWLLRQNKNNIHIFAKDPVICSTSGKGAVLSMRRGYATYQWEFDGIVISNANSNEYTAGTPGVYRGRFKGSSNGWNEWSAAITVSERSPEPAQLAQIGTVLLKDPNGNDEALLQAAGDYAHYYWYKDGAPINFAGQEGDTLKLVKIRSTFGDGVYTLRVADYDNCLSPSSIQKHIYFNDRAKINIVAPTGLILSGDSPSQVSLHWDDVSDNEDGFEIWRRRVDVERHSIWSMAVLTDKNVSSFTDSNLLPSSKYEYMVRAVSNSGRSTYSNVSIIETLPDNTAPSAPTELTVEITGVKEMQLKWRPSEDNSSVFEYLIFTGRDTINTGSQDLSYTIRDFEINSQYSFYVKALDLGHNVSEPSNVAEIYARVSGLFYQHSTGDWNSLEEIDWTIAEFKGTVDHFTLIPKTQEDFFNFRFDGYLNIEKDGVYQFRISSNDGSGLSLDDSLLIVNDGIHNIATVTAPIQLLTAGAHRITVDFFDATLSDSLLVEYKGPDSNNEWVSIPSERLSSDVITAVESPSLSNDFDFSLYPNPSKDGRLNIIFSGTVPGPVSITILANTGQEVYRTVLHIRETQEQIALSDLYPLVSGFYLIEASQNGLRKTKRLILNR